MSRRDVETVATLAAHLAKRWHKPHEGACYAPHDCSVQQAAHDAMALQKLGARAKRNEVKRCNVRDYYRETPHGLPAPDCAYQLEAERIGNVAFDMLKPYGLRASVGGDPRGCCLHIIGLPGNTLGGDEDGFGI